MAKVIKEIGNSVSGVFSATTVAIQATSAVIQSVANSTVTLVDGLAESTSNIVAVSNNYSAELKADSDYSFKKNEMVNKAKQGALDKVLKDTDTLAKLEQAESDSLLRDIFAHLCASVASSLN